MKSILNSMLMLMALMSMSDVSRADVMVNVRVDGMACSFCAYGLEKGLMDIDGVHHVDIDFETGVVTVSAEDDIEITEDEISTLIDDAGYTFRGMQYSDIKSLKTP